MPGGETKIQKQADFDPQGGSGPGMAAQCKRDWQAMCFVQKLAKLTNISGDRSSPSCYM